MKNKNLYDALRANGIKGIESTLVLEIRKGYNVVVEFFEDGTILIGNFYKDSNTKYDGGSRFTIFSGKCENIAELKNLARIINIEDDAKVLIRNLKHDYGKQKD